MSLAGALSADVVSFVTVAARVSIGAIICDAIVVLASIYLVKINED